MPVLRLPFAQATLQPGFAYCGGFPFTIVLLPALLCAVRAADRGLPDRITILAMDDSASEPVGPTIATGEASPRAGGRTAVSSRCRADSADVVEPRHFNQPRTMRTIPFVS